MAKPEDEEIQFNSGLNPDVESYLRQQSLERERTQSPDYQARLAALRNSQYGGDMAPQRLAAYGQAFSQIGALGGKTAAPTALNQFSQGIQSEQNLANQREQKDMDAQDKQTGLYMKTLQFLDEKKRREQETQDKIQAHSQLQQDKMEEARQRAADRASLAGAVHGSSEDMKQAMFQLKRDEFEEKKEARLAKAAEGKAPNKDQFSAGSYGKRVEQANDIMDNLEKGGFNRASALSGLAAVVPGFMQGEKSKQQEQAERNFVNAVLRRESGAAIASTEFDSAEKQYFPRAGDTPAVLSQKRQNRDQALENLKAESGNAWAKIPSVPLQKPAVKSMFGESEAQAAPKSAPSMTPPDKVNVMSPDGTPGTIPRANLERAIQRGFRQVE